MKDQYKTKKLVEELEAMRKQLAKLEKGRKCSKRE